MYNHKDIDKKWQKRWEQEKIFHAQDGSNKPKYYCLIEFPYPSGDGLHMGHPRSYTALDVIARKRRMEGFNVLYPIGWDAFGLPTENYAIKTGRKPQDVTRENTDTFRRQLQSLGISFDWSREINTTDPEYYKWTQWQFLEFFKAGLAYKDKMAINWCLSCKIGLANEEVVSGECERCHGPVEKRDKEQWMIAITKYADRLLTDLDTVDYLPKIKKQQQDWIGKSEGAEIDFVIDNDLSGYKVLGLHSYKGASNTAFWPWLKNELEQMDAAVTVLDLPNSAEPNISEQIEFIKKSFDFDEKTIVVTHSLGAMAAMKLLPELKSKIAKLVMVAPPARPGEFLDGVARPVLDDCCDWKFDFDAIKNGADKIVILQDKGDKVVPKSHAEFLAEKLSVDLIVGQGNNSHFDGEQEPDVLHALRPSLKVFTTRPDTLFGATYMVLAPEHELVSKIVTNDQRSEVENYVKDARKKSDIERGDATKDKTGVFTGAYAINPANDEKIPIWVADYVMMGYGTGAIMAVPAHDERDFEFATKFDLPIIKVVRPEALEQTIAASTLDHVSGKGSQVRVESDCFAGYGETINSDFLNGKKTKDAISSMNDWLEENGKGKRAINYRLRDWVFSRQRYWGEPIPLIHCDDCGWVPVPVADLPVVLPEVDKYEPTDDGESPLSTITDWVNTNCPKCGGSAKRETDTMPNWAGSSWYFLAYAMFNGLHEKPSDKLSTFNFQLLTQWMPVDLYDGGMEHTTLHLLYSRFWNKFLFDRGIAPTSEPYIRRHSHGLILAEDGRKMSKSLGNVVNPDEIIGEFGADSLRVYEMFIGPFEEPVPWSTNGLIGVRRFLDKVMKLVPLAGGNEPESVTRALHKTIKKITEDIEGFRFNTAVSQMMIFVNEVNSAGQISEKSLLKFAELLCPFAPHAANELAFQLGGQDLLENHSWPKYDQSLTIDDVVTIAVQVNGKLRGTIQTSLDISEADVIEQSMKQENVAKFVEGEPKKVIYVKGKLINFVV